MFSYGWRQPSLSNILIQQSVSVYVTKDSLTNLLIRSYLHIVPILIDSVKLNVALYKQNLYAIILYTRYSSPYSLRKIATS